MKIKDQLLLVAFTLQIVASIEAGAVTTRGSVRSQALLGASAVVAIPPESPKVKSFREWKSEKVQNALARVTAAKTKIQVVKSKDPNLDRNKANIEANSGANTETLETQLQQDQSTLEMAKDLSVTDYFAGYLTKLQDKKSAFNEVAGKLTAEEVAELMAAYANSVFGTHSPDLPPSANDISSDRIR
ncbi:MAG TPA: hypothetical protein VIG33_09900 [Pseudobdellovibrionaceae bacterium]